MLSQARQSRLQDNMGQCPKLASTEDTEVSEMLHGEFRALFEPLGASGWGSLAWSARLQVAGIEH